MAGKKDNIMGHGGIHFQVPASMEGAATAAWTGSRYDGFYITLMGKSEM